MKKPILLTLLLIMGYGSAQSQFRFDFFSGLNLTSLRPAEYMPIAVSESEMEELVASIGERHQNRILPFIGLRFQYEIFNKLLVNLEPQLSLKGQKWQGPEHSELSIYYDIVPSISYEFMDNTLLSVGGYVGFRTSTRFTDFYPSTASMLRTDRDNGLMLSLEHYVHSFILRASYYHGLGNIGTTKRSWTDDETPPFVSVIFKHRLFQLGIGYRFIKGKDRD